jgi:hypothetical protein
LKEGKGIEHYLNREVYEGKFKAGKKNGKGCARKRRKLFMKDNGKQ